MNIKIITLFFCLFTNASLVIGQSFKTEMIIQSMSGNEDNHESECFGRTMDLVGNTLLVGARCDHRTTEGVVSFRKYGFSGAAYIFNRVNDKWVQRAYLKSPSPTYDAQFGWSIVVFDDEKTVAIGTIEDEAVYIFSLVNEQWVLTSTLKPSHAQDRIFGYTLATSGNTLAIGVKYTENSATETEGGAVYIFKRQNGEWSEEAYLRPDDSAKGDGFGFSLALSNDTLAVGAIGVNAEKGNPDTADAGATYLFKKIKGVWQQHAFLQASNAEKEDKFGASVALYNNLLAVGAPQEDSGSTIINGDQGNLLEDPNTYGGEESGAIYLFAQVNNLWQQIAYIKNSDTIKDQNFGLSIAFNSDGTLAAETSNINCAIYFFNQVNNQWKETIKRSVDCSYRESQPDGRFNSAQSVAISGNTAVFGLDASDEALIYNINVTEIIKTNTIFDWAEKSFPDLFPHHYGTFTFKDFLVRGKYPEFNRLEGNFKLEGNFMGTFNDKVYVYGDPWNGLLEVGEVEQFYQLTKSTTP